MEKKSNLEKLKNLSSGNKPDWFAGEEFLDESKDWLDDSFKVAVLVLRAMREKGISQKDLAKILDVTPQYVSKILKGRENLSLGTINKLKVALGLQKVISIADASSYFVMTVTNGPTEYQSAVQGTKAEQSYIDSLQNHPKNIIGLYSKANTFAPAQALEYCNQ
jgi:transcriptional regulator with XRE-family HTH domain